VLGGAALRLPRCEAAAAKHVDAEDVEVIAVDDLDHHVL